MRSSSSSCLARLLIALVFVWIMLVLFAGQLSTWLAGAFSVQLHPSGVTLLCAALGALPLLPLARFWPEARYRGIFRTWLVATLVLALLAPARLLPGVYSQLILLAQLGSLLLALLLIRQPGRLAKPSPHVVRGLAAGAGALLALPWLWRGALGSALDTLLALAVGACVGVLVMRMRARFSLPPPASAGVARSLFSDGLVVGLTLLIIAAGLSANGVQLLLMLALPAMGWAVAGLSETASRAGQASPSPSTETQQADAILIGLVSGVILACADTDVTLLEALDPAGLALFQAAGLTMLLGWLLAPLVPLLRQSRGRPRSWMDGAALLWIGALAFYTFWHPGLYGDRLFVIMREQADVAQAATIADYDARRQFVYQTLSAHADRSQADLRRRLERFGVGYTPYYLVNAVEVRGGLFARLLLLGRDDIDRILPSPRLRPAPDPLAVSRGDAEAPAGAPWNVRQIGADRVWQELDVRGAGIVIGQSDSGVQWDHPELQAGYLGRNGDHSYHWLDPWGGSLAPIDYGGHGTHTLGTVLGANVGVAPAASWIGCANLQRNLGNPALYLDCMQFMLAPYPQGGDPLRAGDATRSAHVLNNSWGCPAEAEGCDPQSLEPAVRALEAAGIFVVVSAGNDGPACRSLTAPPATYVDVLSVGAVDEARQMASFSSAGPVTADGSERVKPDIVAPGVRVLSAFPGSSYARSDGTSMAGPHVAGVVALMWSANPQLIGDIEATRRILTETATALPPQDAAAPESCAATTDLSQRPNPVSGYGEVDAYAAVRAALAER